MFEENLNRIIRCFDISNFEIEKLENFEEEFENLKFKLNYINSSFKVKANSIDKLVKNLNLNEQKEQHQPIELINFSQIINDFKLKYYDKNLNFGYCKSF